jgi:putative tricarboxylic transport membrane protein
MSGETLLALAAVAFGVLIIWQTTLIRLTPAYSKVGPRVIPYIVGAGMVIVGALAGVRGAHRPYRDG